MKCSFYIVFPSVLSFSNLKLYQTLEVKNIFKQESMMLQLTFNPGLTLTSFRTTRPWWQAAISCNLISSALPKECCWKVSYVGFVTATERYPNTPTLNSKFLFVHIVSWFLSFCFIATSFCFIVTSPGETLRYFFWVHYAPSRKKIESKGNFLLAWY